LQTTVAGFCLCVPLRALLNIVWKKIYPRCCQYFHNLQSKNLFNIKMYFPTYISDSLNLRKFSPKFRKNHHDYNMSIKLWLKFCLNKIWLNVNKIFRMYLRELASNHKVCVMRHCSRSNVEVVAERRRIARRRRHSNVGWSSPATRNAVTSRRLVFQTHFKPEHRRQQTR
jgi:hypothetical protein